MPSTQHGLTADNPPNYAGALVSLQSTDDRVLPPFNQKRKFHDFRNDSAHWAPFKISADRAASSESSSHVVEATFRPRMLLPRGCLPLAYLDTNDVNKVGIEQKIFTGYIPALDSLEPDHDSECSPSVLVAERDGTSLHAIERVRPGLYAQCRLDDRVTIRHLEEHSSGAFKKSHSKSLLVDKVDRWWQGIVRVERDKGRRQTQTAPADRQIFNLGRPDYMPTKISLPVDEATQAQRVESDDDSNKPHEMPVPEALQPLPEQPLQDPEDALRSIKAQYMESLYRSKASLAYFAKGSLSRARAAFSGSADLAASPHRLIEYLRTLIMPLTSLDKKYRETLPALIAELPKLILPDVERNDVVAQLGKGSRKSKKGKLGKNGLYPQEEADIQQWWFSQLASVLASEPTGLNDDTVKATLLQQRARELSLQIILILEVLALERNLPIPSVGKALDEDDEGHPSQQKRKSKKQQDLSMLLDLSVDRLCIWQSMAVEENTTSEKSQEVKASASGNLAREKPDADHMRDFCVDVVMPL
ncbi:MAG: hypothetical protein Q9219_003371 [cf. Caloplaca sp. 3 TL-2023]